MPNLFQHIVQPGDTLGDLAVWYNTTVTNIENANLGIDPYNLIIGQAILIPILNDDMQLNYQWLGSSRGNFGLPLYSPIDENNRDFEAQKIIFDSIKDADMGRTVNIYRVSGKTAIFFTSKMAIDADGAPCAYNRQNTGCDDIRYASRSTLATRSDGRFCIQGPRDPFPGNYVSMTTLEDAQNKNKCDYRKYVNSEEIPYIALPGGKPLRYRKWGIEIGDFSTVINLRNMKMSHAIFADIGPSNKIGEGSMALANTLGIDPNPRRGGTGKVAYVFYIVYPKTGKGWGKLRTLNEIKEIGSREFQAWGGINQVKSVLS
jgi:LysM repeat protein